MCVCACVRAHVVCMCAQYIQHNIIICFMCRFVPDLDDIVTFEDMVAEDTFSEETKLSAKYI